MQYDSSKLGKFQSRPLGCTFRYVREDASHSGYSVNPIRSAWGDKSITPIPDTKNLRAPRTGELLTQISSLGVRHVLEPSNIENSVLGSPQELHNTMIHAKGVAHHAARPGHPHAAVWSSTSIPTCEGSTKRAQHRSNRGKISEETSTCIRHYHKHQLKESGSWVRRCC